MPKRMLSWLRNLCRRRAVERELEQEIQTSVALLTQEKMKLGLAPADARHAALLELGGIEQVKEEVRAAHAGRWLEDGARDIRYAGRTLAKSPGFTCIAILTLGLGLGAATIIVSLLQRELWQPLPDPHSQRVMAVSIRFSVRGLPGMSPLVNAGFFQRWQQQAPGFQSLSLLQGQGMILTGHGQAQDLHAARVSASLFATLGIHLELGRTFTPAEERQGRDHEVILTWPLWQRLFQGSPRALGSQLTLNGNLYSVIGVLPRGFYLPRLGRLMGQYASSQATPPVEMFNPLGLQKWEKLACPCDMNFIALGRLRAGVTPRQASAQLDLINQRILSGLHLTKVRVKTQLTPLQSIITKPYRRGLLLLALGAVILLLLIAINLANLLLARNSARVHEMAVRSALGAGRERLLRQMLVEMLVQVGAGMVLGLGVAWMGVRLLAADAAIGLPRLAGLRFTPVDLAFLLAAGAAVSALFILPPTFRLLRQAAPESLPASQGTIASHRQSLRLREWLSGAEIALSTLLLSTAVLLAVSLAQVLRVNRMLDSNRALTLKLVVPPSMQYKNAQWLQFYREVLERVRDLGNVQAAGLISQLPLQGQAWPSNVIGERLEPAVDFQGLPVRPPHQGNFRFISSGYFRAAGIPILAGTSWPPNRRDVAVVSESVVRQVLGGRNPIGMRINGFNQQHELLQVVGVAADVRANPEQPASLTVYEPYQDWSYQDLSLVVRTKGNWRQLAGSLGAVVRGISPDIPLRPPQPLSHLVSAATHARRFQTMLAIGYALAAALLAALGLYGVLAASVTLRRHEIAIRMALGANRAVVHRLVLRQIVRLLLYGLAAGLGCALLLARFLAGVLYGVSAFNPWVYLGVAAVLGLIALAAGSWPARQASRLDPARILHAE